MVMKTVTPSPEHEQGDRHCTDFFTFSDFILQAALESQAVLPHFTDKVTAEN